MKSSVLAKIRTRDARIAVFGLGYVGLPLALRFSDERFRVLGFDIDAAKIETLRAGRTYIEHIPAERISAALERGFEPTADLARAIEADALVICVPTPLTKQRQPDVSFVTGTMDSIAPHLRRGQLVSLESTTYPGTTEEELRPRIEGRGLVVGEDVFLVYSPEREDPGNAQFSARSIPKICGGSTANCLELAVALYGAISERVVSVSSTRAAEMTKLLENIHRAVNIGLVNEMKMIADRMGLDVHEIIEAAATKPFGFVPYQPGPGLGGHCIPIDPFYLTWKAREFGLHTRFIELAGEINSNMPEWVVQKFVDALNERGKAMRGSRVLVLGLAYKRNVDDTRESPAVALMEILRAKGAHVDYSDPHVPKFPKLRAHHFDLRSVALTPESLSSYDAVLIATDHDCFDWAAIARHAQLVIDTRGVYTEKAPHIVRA